MLLDKFRRSDAGPSDELASVLANLNRILNTKKGFGHWLDGFGLGDFNEHRGRTKIVKRLIGEIKENIQLFEPRVKIESIEEVEADSPFRLRFQARCVFADRQKPFHVVVDSVRHEVTIEDSHAPERK